MRLFDCYRMWRNTKRVDWTMVAEIDRIPLPPRTKPRSWSAEFWTISARGQPRSRVVVEWKRKEVPSGASGRR